MSPEAGVRGDGSDAREVAVRPCRARTAAARSTTRGFPSVQFLGLGL